jgi:hypothetical protein
VSARWFVVAFFGAVAAGCGPDRNDGAMTSTTVTSTTVTSTRAPVTPPPSSPPTAPPTPVEARDWCARTGTEVLGTVADPAIVEASGMVASRSHPGVFWVHNDGPDPRVFAIDRTGRTLGVHDVAADVSDLEDIAIWSGPNGDEILLGDIGDNGARRERVRVIRFPEPDPYSTSPIAAFAVDDYRYPDRPHNAETLLVDDRAGRIVVVTKEQARTADGKVDPLGATLPSAVFEGPIGAAGVSTLFAAGAIDTPLLETLTVSEVPHPATGLGFGGVPTGGDVSPDGTLVALRTYETVWLWDRRDDESVAEALRSTPCQVTTVVERQGEAVTFGDDGLLTISEGEQQALHRVAVIREP